jgi:hypothetical protein
VAELSFWTSAAGVPWGKNKANQFDAEKLVNAVRGADARPGSVLSASP